MFEEKGSAIYSNKGRMGDAVRPDSDCGLVGGAWWLSWLGTKAHRRSAGMDTRTPKAQLRRVIRTVVTIAEGLFSVAQPIRKYGNRTGDAYKDSLAIRYGRNGPVCTKTHAPDVYNDLCSSGFVTQLGNRKATPSWV